MNQDLVLHAPNVSSGGGLVLLRSLWSELSKHCNLRYALLDARVEPFQLSCPSTQILYFKSSLSGRFKAESSLRQLAKKSDTIFCFGNLPPLFPVPSKVIVFLQNRYLIEDTSLRGFSPKVKTRIALERFWLKSRLRMLHKVIVQTPTMAAYFRKSIPRYGVLQVSPFVGEDSTTVSGTAADKQCKYEYVYVSSTEPHKNHQRLIEAWILLAQEKQFPRLCLTLNRQRDIALINRIETIKVKYSCRIDFIDNASHEQVLALYREARALIFPSLFESFGLPLFEARSAGIDILAPERDYVRDIVRPDETFDPESPCSIARAVKRHLDLREDCIAPLTPSEFLQLSLA